MAEHDKEWQILSLISPGMACFPPFSHSEQNIDEQVHIQASDEYYLSGLFSIRFEKIKFIF